MKVTLKTATPDAEITVVEIARVSSSREDKKAEPEKLIKYLLDHKHFSPFEHAFMTVEIETSKAIGIQLLRHRSFTFQEFSQRYQNVGELSSEGETMFEPVELRKQAETNRQSSTEAVKDSSLEVLVELHLRNCERTYNLLLEKGVAREVARMVLPMTTKTRMYMTGNIRSWIHFLQLRDDAHAQKEIQEVAREIKQIFKQQFPLISNALEL